MWASNKNGWSCQPPARPPLHKWQALLRHGATKHPALYLENATPSAHELTQVSSVLTIMFCPSAITASLEIWIKY